MRILHINCNFMDTPLHQNLVNKIESVEFQNLVFVPMFHGRKITVKKTDNAVFSECFNKYDRVFYFYKQKKIYKSLIKSVPDVSKYDIVHAHTLFTDGNCAFSLYKEFGIPYIVAVRNTDVNSFLKLKKYLIPRALKILKNAKAVIFISATYKNAVIRKYVPEKLKKAIEEKSFVIPNGIDDFWLENINIKLDQKKTARLKNKTVKLVYAGKIIKNKNPELTVKACEVLIKKGYNMTFTVIGRADNQRLYEKIIKNKFVKYIPNMEKEELIKAFRKNDIFVMPSKTETFGLAYAEAISQGLPVVYSKGQGFDGQFSEGQVGFHCCSSSADELSDAVVSICNAYEDIAGRCAECSRAFDWNEISKRYRKIYRSIAP